MFPFVQKEWPLDLYRRRSGGWEKHIPAGTADCHHLQPNAMGKPMRGCVTIKRYRLKINLKDEKAGRMEVVRRNKCILFTPQSNRHATIMLQFPTLKDCLEFSDELMLLNQSLYQLEDNHPSRPSAATLDAPQKSETKKTDHFAAGKNPVTPAPGLQRNQIYCQIVELVQDESFLAFTAKVEDLIQSAPDGNQILKALERGSHPENNHKN
jgi:hypothetical protein